jgi:hypothetical protein
MTTPRLFLRESINGLIRQYKEELRSNKAIRKKLDFREPGYGFLLGEIQTMQEVIKDLKDCIIKDKLK